VAILCGSTIGGDSAAKPARVATGNGMPADSGMDFRHG